MKSRKEFGTQYDWLYYLQNNLGCNDLEIQGSKTDKEGNVFWYKRHNFLELCHTEDKQWLINKATHRSILDVEIVLDLDEPSFGFKTIEETARYYHRKLKEYEDIKYYTYTTGSKGFHIHIFVYELRRPHNNDELKKFIYKKLGTDKLKLGRNMIALEGAKHWKSGKIKEEVKWD